MKAWQYITALIAFVGTGILLLTNLLAAWEGTNPGLWRWIMLCVSASADLGLVGFLFATISNHHSGRMLAVYMAAFMWALCGFYTAASSTRWLEGQFKSITEPARIAGISRAEHEKYIEGRLDIERASLSQANNVAVNGSTITKRAEARVEAGHVRARIDGLVKQKWHGSEEPVKDKHVSVEHVFIGYEWLFPIALLFFSQASWFVTFGTIGHGAAQSDWQANHLANQPYTSPNHSEIPLTSRTTNDEVIVDNDSQPVLWKADQPNQCYGKLTTITRHDYDKLTSLPNQPNQPDTLPNHSEIPLASILTNDEVTVRNGSQPELWKADQSNQPPNQPTKQLVNQPNQCYGKLTTSANQYYGKLTSGDDQQGSLVSVQFGRTFTSKVNIANTIENTTNVHQLKVDDHIRRLLRNGVSERVIATRLSVKRSYVQRVRRSIPDAAVAI